jgi:hypothetical protein
VPQIYLRPRSEPPRYSSVSPPAAVERALGGFPHRRWLLWLGRFGLLTAIGASAFLLVEATGNVERRESLAMSLLAVAVFGIVFLTWAHETINLAGKEPRTRLMKATLTAGASCVSVGVFLIGGQADPVHVRTKTNEVNRPLPGVLDAATGLAIHDEHLDRLPRFSARMTGASQAPIGLVFLGSGCDLLEAFAKAGWHAAERITPRSALRAFGRGVMNRPYHCAPVFPSFLEGKLHDVAFQQTTAGGSSRRRHHARWWLTEFTCEGNQVWVATASYDAGVGVGRFFPTPIHHIDPDIDAERDYITRSLTDTGYVRVTQELRVTEPMAGRNAAGDPFYTQGMAFVLA